MYHSLDTFSKNVHINKPDQFDVRQAMAKGYDLTENKTTFDTAYNPNYDVQGVKVYFQVNVTDSWPTAIIAKTATVSPFDPA